MIIVIITMIIGIFLLINADIIFLVAYKQRRYETNYIKKVITHVSFLLIGLLCLTVYEFIHFIPLRYISHTFFQMSIFVADIAIVEILYIKRKDLYKKIATIIGIVQWSLFIPVFITGKFSLILIYSFLCMIPWLYFTIQLLYKTKNRFVYYPIVGIMFLMISHIVASIGILIGGSITILALSYFNVLLGVSTWVYGVLYLFYRGTLYKINQAEQNLEYKKRSLGQIIFSPKSIILIVTFILVTIISAFSHFNNERTLEDQLFNTYLNLGVELFDKEDIVELSNELYKNPDSQYKPLIYRDLESTNNLYMSLVKIKKAIDPFTEIDPYLYGYRRNEDGSIGFTRIPENDSATVFAYTNMYDKDDLDSQPGFQYPIDEYPDMQDALYSSDKIVISNILYDNVYEYWTQSGNIKIYYDDKVIAVFAIDYSPKSFNRLIVISILKGIIYGFIAAQLLGLYMLLTKCRNKD